MTAPSPANADAELAELAAVADELAADAAALLVEGVARTDLAFDTKSSHTDVVTEVDRAAEARIVEGLARRRPHDGVLGEEGSAHDGTSGVRWIIDPIDGTTNFLYGLPGFSVSIAAERDGEVVVGVVAVPLHGDVFRAVRGGGATRNGAPIRCSAETDLSRSLVATGFAYDPARRRRQAAVLGGLIDRIRDIRRVGAASVDLCAVGAGRVDAYYERGLQPWDHAAGALVAAEAGARVADLDGGPLGAGVVLAAAPVLWDPLAELLHGLGAADA